MSGRNLLLAGGVMVAGLASAIVAWIAADQAASSAATSSAQAPQLSIVTTPVELVKIETVIAIRGVVEGAESQTIRMPVRWDDSLDPVVTWIPEVGELIAEGDVLFEIAGRPTFALFGEIPLFRDVHPMDHGVDIAEFQDALRHLGFDPGESDGVYGPNTESAMVLLYESHGYAPLPLGGEVLDRLDEASLQVAVREAAYEAAESQLAGAKEDRTAAEEVASDARAAASEAERRLASAIAGVHPDTGEPPTPQQLQTLEVMAATSLADADAARVTFEEASALTLRLAAEAAGLKEGLEAAVENLYEARQLTERTAPASEFLFFKQFPLRVESVAVQRGDLGVDEIMSVSTSSPTLKAGVPPEYATFVAVGDPVRVDIGVEGGMLEGEVVRVGSGVDSGRHANDEVPITVSVEGLPNGLHGENLRLELTLEPLSSRDEVLAVPSSAVITRASGESVIVLLTESGEERIVEVTLGLTSTSGVVEIVSAAGDIAVGDSVRVDLSLDSIQP